MQDNISIDLYEDIDVIKKIKENEETTVKRLIATLLEKLLCNNNIVDKWYTELNKTYITLVTDYDPPPLLEWMENTIRNTIEWDIFDDPIDSEQDEQDEKEKEWSKNWEELRARKKALESVEFYKFVPSNEFEKILKTEMDNCKKVRDFAKITINVIKIVPEWTV